MLPEPTEEDHSIAAAIVFSELLALEPPIMFEESSAFNSIQVATETPVVLQTPKAVDTKLNTSYSGELFITR